MQIRWLLPLLLAFAPMTATAEPIYASSFETDFTDHWDATSKKGGEAVLEVVDAELPDGRTEKVLRIDDSANHGSDTYLSVTRYFEKQANRTLLIRYKFRFLSKGIGPKVGFDWRLRLLGGGETLFLRMRDKEGNKGISHLEVAPNQFRESAIGVLYPDAWYEVELTVNLVGKHYSWKARSLAPGSEQSANGENVPFLLGQSSNADRISLTTISRGGVMELCDVTITTVD